MYLVCVGVCGWGFSQKGGQFPLETMKIERPCLYFNRCFQEPDEVQSSSKRKRVTKTKKKKDGDEVDAKFLKDDAADEEEKEEEKPKKKMKKNEAEAEKTKKVAVKKSTAKASK